MATTSTPRIGTATSGGRRLNRKTSDLLWALVFVGPQLLGLIVFSLLPLLAAFYLSLTNWDGFGDRSFVGVQNFVEQFRSPDLGIALWNTLLYTLVAVPGGLMLSLLVALGLNNIAGKTFYRLLYFMPVVTGSVAVSVVWLYLLNDDFGIINTYVQSWFGIDLPSWLTDSRFVVPALAVIGIWWGLGYNMVIFLAGLQNVPTSLVEAAQIDGANKWQIFRNVTLPLLSPTIFFLTVTSLIGSFQVFDQANVMTGGGPGKASYTMVFHIYTLAFKDFTFGKSSSAAVILFLVILLVTIFQLYAQKRWVHYED
ncbi:MAG: sugar ABC transporter permease [Chloroflexota bacterium]|nr:sugar ABC transporter permease [Chloroflexota bacterium]